MTPQEMVRYHERRATQAEAVVRAASAIHFAEGRRKKRCAECGQVFPCRTALIVGDR